MSGCKAKKTKRTISRTHFAVFILGAPCGLNATAPLWQCGVNPGPWWVQNATASLTGAYSWSPEWLNATASTDRDVLFEPFVAHLASPMPCAGDANATMPLSWGTNFEPYGLKPPKLLKLVVQPLSPGGLTLCALPNAKLGARMERIQPTNPEPKPGEEPTAQRERRRPKDWESSCGDINPRLITFRGRSMRSRITSLYPCVDAVYIQRVPLLPQSKAVIENALEASVLKKSFNHTTLE